MQWDGDPRYIPRYLVLRLVILLLYISSCFTLDMTALHLVQHKMSRIHQLSRLFITILNSRKRYVNSCKMLWISKTAMNPNINSQRSEWFISLHNVLDRFITFPKVMNHDTNWCDASSLHSRWKYKRKNNQGGLRRKMVVFFPIKIIMI